MKKILSYIMLLGLLVSCQKEMPQLPSENDGETLVDKTFVSPVQARTALSGSSVSWTSSDKVSVFDGKANRRFAVSVDGGDAEIYGKAADVASYCLLYPYDDGASYASGVISTLLPDTQKPLKEGFDPNANILAAVTESNAVRMSNVCGLLKFTVS